MQNGWENVGEGVTRGPLETIHAGDAAVEIRPYRDGEGGFMIELNAPGELVPVGDVSALLAAIQAAADRAVPSC
ncbi:hypothetical protein [Georgenia sp. MJ170]|uniref:hypothetical protein n=1 Tax=Georgenia sunbinii TaxID=3117728 RepID=UPI002F269E23